MNFILEAKGLIKDYPKLRAVDGVSFELKKGICFGLLGPNGAGKTTTVEMLEGIVTPSAGEILFKGEPAGSEFRARAGIQFQATALQDYLKVSDVLKLFGSLYSQRASVDEIIDLCDIGGFLNQYTDELSGGQRQRVLLAVALVNDPEVLFLDEPTTGLDPQARRGFWDLIHKLKKRGKTILLTTHYMEEAYELCDEIAIMDSGKIIARGEPDHLLKKYFQTMTLKAPLSDNPGLSGWLSRQKLNARDTVGVKESEESLEIQTTDVSLVLRELLEAGSDLSHLEIRRPSLEDLFLHLTGKELRE